MDSPELEHEVIRALRDLPTEPSDAGAVRLALTYAWHIDEGGDLSKLGPALLACLTALGMTPAARAALAKGGTGEPAASPLDELRARRAARANRTATVDAPAS